MVLKEKKGYFISITCLNRTDQQAFVKSLRKSYVGWNIQPVTYTGYTIPKYILVPFKDKEGKK